MNQRSAPTLPAQGAIYSESSPSAYSGLRVPWDPGELLLARDPIGRREDARCGVNQPGRKLKDIDGGPWPAIARVQAAQVQHIGHARERQVLHDHFGEKAQYVHFRGILLEVAAISCDSQAVR